MRTISLVLLSSLALSRPVPYTVEADATGHATRYEQKTVRKNDDSPALVRESFTKVKLPIREQVINSKTSEKTFEEKKYNRNKTYDADSNQKLRSKYEHNSNSGSSDDFFYTLLEHPESLRKAKINLRFEKDSKYPAVVTIVDQEDSSKPLSTICIVKQILKDAPVSRYGCILSKFNHLAKSCEKCDKQKTEKFVKKIAAMKADVEKKYRNSGVLVDSKTAKEDLVFDLKDKN